MATASVSVPSGKLDSSKVILGDGFRFYGINSHPYVAIFFRRQEGKDTQYVEMTLENALLQPMDVLEPNPDPVSRTQMLEHLLWHKIRAERLGHDIPFDRMKADLSKEFLERFGYPSPWATEEVES